MENKFIDIVEYEGVKEIILNDEHSLNSLSENLSRELLAEINSAEADPDVRVLVISGRGKLFCSGGNLKEFLAAGDQIAVSIDRLIEEVYNPLASCIRNLSKPVLSAINGSVIGAGVGLALCADVVYASEEASFTLPFVPRMGLVPDFGSSWLLPRLLGGSKAAAMILTGESMTAAEAEKAGMIWKVVAKNELSSVVREAAIKLSKLPPEAVALAKQALNAAQTNSFDEQLELEQELQVACFRGREVQEGISAFAERREPNFSEL
ncbi:enoyl-CoA hydratase/isomerase family protein [Oceanicoccus sp. KOV_DT_Chl]|uniref:enoyl-CoA hydratase/isomerase family protein n=1 Tax=Oceanicoccus sp. KOV_DT_Chl TaxID=1904639 RepID=UPI000C7AE64D|nr:enoyl-CoA hydratase-related protein [Oceanicoccus sp. KOV_DT_Chl]